MDEILLKTLHELEETQKQFWNISKATGNFLNMLVKMNNSKHLLEIGTSNGYSGLWFLEALQHTGGDFTTIEFHEQRLIPAKENFIKCGFEGKFRLIQGKACEIIESMSKDEMFDFVFIDANKEEYVKDLELIKPHLLPNAVIAADNINSHHEKVRPFLEKIYEDPDFQTEIINLPDGLSLSYKLR